MTGFVFIYLSSSFALLSKKTAFVVGMCPEHISSPLSSLFKEYISLIYVLLQAILSGVPDISLNFISQGVIFVWVLYGEKRDQEGCVRQPRGGGDDMSAGGRKGIVTPTLFGGAKIWGRTGDICIDPWKPASLQSLFKNALVFLQYI